MTDNDNGIIIINDQYYLLLLLMILMSQWRSIINDIIDNDQWY